MTNRERMELADRASENLIREILLGACPQDGFCGRNVISLSRRRRVFE